jgi:hypothetical protein
MTNEKANEINLTEKKDDLIYILQVNERGWGEKPPIFVRVLDPTAKLLAILRPIEEKAHLHLDKSWVAPRSNGITLEDHFDKLPSQEVPFSDIRASWDGPAVDWETVMLTKMTLVPQVKIADFAKRTVRHEPPAPKKQRKTHRKKSYPT